MRVSCKCFKNDRDDRGESAFLKEATDEMSKRCGIRNGKEKKSVRGGNGMEKSKKSLMQLLICIGLLCVIWGVYVWEISRINEKERRQIELQPDDFTWVYQIDEVVNSGKELILEGFAFQLDVDAIDNNYEIVLHNIESGENEFPKMEYMERDDVNDFFSCEYDYLNSGFKATYKVKETDLQENDYEILLRVLGEKKAYQTGGYLTDGQLMYANPKEYVSLDVIGTDLEKVVIDGILRVYRPDVGMYVYQHAGDLYWIAEPEYGFVDGDTYVECQLDTTQIERLPQHRLENQWYFDNIGFWFSMYELLEGNTGKYRVAKKALPTEYAIERMWTGKYASGWIWNDFFRPYYETLTD